MTALAGRVHILPCKSPLVVRDSLKAVVLKETQQCTRWWQQEDEDQWQRNSRDYRKGQRDAMKNGMEERLINRRKDHDLLYCRRNGYRWPKCGNWNLLEVDLDLMLLQAHVTTAF